MSLKERLGKQVEDATNSFKSGGGNSGSIITGVIIPVEIERSGGKLRLYLEVPPEAVESAEMLNATLDEIEKSFDLAIWRKNNSYNNGSGFKRNNNYRKY